MAGREDIQRVVFAGAGAELETVSLGELVRYARPSGLILGWGARMAEGKKGDDRIRFAFNEIIKTAGWRTHLRLQSWR